jgi:hydroxymethylpyrimidine pyrophosphatase-like HAD family hydrolase
MKLSVLALDYDGTVAQNDRLEPSVRDAIAVVRGSGIVTLLVTGRILTELQRVAGPLHFVDGIVAENGAVVHFADTGHTTPLAPILPDAFIHELRARGIPHHAGQCLVDADAADAHRILQVIRDLELPLVLLFNKGRVMTLPQGVSKATGLHVALDTLRLSSHNLLAIGDAENDHELLRLAEVGGAVAWGSSALRRAADVIVPGTGPGAVSAYIRDVAAAGRLPVPAQARRRLRLGYADDGREFSLAVRGRNVLIAGDAKSGKSWVAGLLCEQLILYGYCLCVLDPEGDYRSLEALPGVTVLGGDEPPPTQRELLRALQYPDRSVVVDLSHQTQDEKIDYIRTVLPALNELRRQTGLPHRIVLDEAHYFLHDAGANHLLDLERNGYIVATYWASRLPPELLSATEVMIVTRESNPSELDALRQLCAKSGEGDRSRWVLLTHLRVGQGVALPITAEADGDLRLFTMGPRLTPHVRHREKYIDVPIAERHAFYFGADGWHAPRRARTLREFVTVVEASQPADLDPYLQRGDFSRWVGDIFGDAILAADLRKIEARHRGAPNPDSIPAVVAAIRSRYDLVDDELGIPPALAKTSPAPGADASGGAREGQSEMDDSALVEVGTSLAQVGPNEEISNVADV